MATKDRCFWRDVGNISIHLSGDQNRYFKRKHDVRLTRTNHFFVPKPNQRKTKLEPKGIWSCNIKKRQVFAGTTDAGQLAAFILPIALLKSGWWVETQISRGIDLDTKPERSPSSEWPSVHSCFFPSPSSPSLPPPPAGFVFVLRWRVSTVIPPLPGDSNEGETMQCDN